MTCSRCKGTGLEPQPPKKSAGQQIVELIEERGNADLKEHEASRLLSECLDAFICIHGLDPDGAKAKIDVSFTAPPRLVFESEEYRLLIEVRPVLGSKRLSATIVEET